MVREEEKRWPGWVACATEVPEEYFQRREREWALADRVVVNSEFSRQALIQQGVPSGKLAVIPLCFEENVEKLKIRKLKMDVSVSPFQFSASSPLSGAVFGPGRFAQGDSIPDGSGEVAAERAGAF